MIDLEPGEELGLVAETARKLAQEELLPRLREAEAAREVEPEVRAAYREIGLAELELPEEAGGAGFGALARVLVNEELAAADVGAAVALDPLGPALYPWLEMGGDPSAPARAAGEAGRVLLVSDLEAQVQLDAERVCVEAAWVPTESANAVVVLAGGRAALVSEGFEITPLRGAGLRAAGAGTLRIDAPPDGAVLEDAPGATRARARIRLYVASLMLGAMRASWEFASAYAQQREAFGRPIAHHQALAFLITDMRMALDGARLLVREAAWRVDAGLPCEVAASSALAQCIEAARTLGPDGVQVLGGHGFMADYPVEKHMRELRALGLLFGGFDAAVQEAGERLSASQAPLGLGVGEGL